MNRLGHCQSCDQCGFQQFVVLLLLLVAVIVAEVVVSVQDSRCTTETDIEL